MTGLAVHFNILRVVDTSKLKKAACISSKLCTMNIVVYLMSFNDLNKFPALLYIIRRSNTSLLSFYHENYCNKITSKYACKYSLQ